MPARILFGFLATLSLLMGCAQVGTRIDDDITAFSNGVNAILTAGMPLKEARAAVRQKFPKPDHDIESAPLIDTRGKSVQVRRFMMVWSTMEPDTQFVLTLECDSEMRVARWSVGPLYNSR